MENEQLAQVTKTLDAIRDVLTVKRVFGEPYEVDGATIIPVATVRGGGGGGGGEGTGEDGDDRGSGAGGGLGFGTNVRPVGVYIVKDGGVTWQPSVDVTRLVAGGQILGAIALLTVRSLFRKR
jgi:uncharacterized spore protein YtfJ